MKRLLAANRQFRTIDDEVTYAEQWLLGLTSIKALRKAGVLSDNSYLNAFVLHDLSQQHGPPHILSARPLTAERSPANSAACEMVRPPLDRRRLSLFKSRISWWL